MYDIVEVQHIYTGLGHPLMHCSFLLSPVCLTGLSLEQFTLRFVHSLNSHFYSLLSTVDVRFVQYGGRGYLLSSVMSHI